METDKLRLLLNYLLASIALFGAMVMVAFQVVKGEITGDVVLPWATGIIGSVLGWALTRETQTGAQRAAERQMRVANGTEPPST